MAPNGAATVLHVGTEETFLRNALDARESRDDGEAPDVSLQSVETLAAAREYLDGIGLWIVHWILPLYRGRTRDREPLLRGTVVRLRMPSAGDRLE